MMEMIKTGWFILGMNMFFITLAIIIVNYSYLDGLNGWEQMKLGIPITLSLVCGSWMIAHSIKKQKESEE